MLVARARNDRRAFASLYRRYVGPVYGYCVRRLGGKEAAEDATSLVFARALAGLPVFRGDRPFRSWLFAIAHNVVVDGHRARRPESPLAEAADLVAADPSPEELALAADERDAVRALLAQLPPAQRRVVELRLAGLSGAEVAQVLGRTPGAVKIAQVRAYARLRAVLGGEPLEPSAHRPTTARETEAPRGPR